MIIAIDGPAASGKGTIARRLADHYGLRHLDTGLLYRAVARNVLAVGGDLGDAAVAARAASRLDESRLCDPALRTARIGEAASQVARQPQVRAVLLAYQREFAQREPGAVIDGRDIGTVICPDAEVKFFVTASPEVRARRRFLELSQSGADLKEADVLADIHARDERDLNREASPLARAEDAVLLDTTNLDIDAAFRAAFDLVEAAMGRTGRAG